MNGFQWCNSRNISGFKVIDNHLIIRLHNGSLYKFENVIGNINIKLSSTLREDILGNLIRNEVNYYLIGNLQMNSDSKETDIELISYYVKEKDLKKTIMNNQKCNEKNIII